MAAYVYDAETSGWKLLTGPSGQAGPGLPGGGSDGQVVNKVGSVPFETAWAQLTSVPGARIFSQPTAPSNPADGDWWYDSTAQAPAVHSPLIIGEGTNRIAHEQAGGTTGVFMAADGSFSFVANASGVTLGQVGDALSARLGGVVVSTSDPVNEDYPDGTLWVKV